MRANGKLGLMLVLALATAVGGYFGAYFLAADYTDMGDQRPMYLLSYRIGSHSLYGLRSFFEPARRVDAFLRGRPAVIVSGGS
jgi:hypothetical protein